MSIEYTIDIQLTELGYSDILQPGTTSDGETPSQSPPSLSTTHLQRLDHPADLPQLITDQPDTREKDVEGGNTTHNHSTEMQQDGEDDSDDSDVYEEEEVDEDDEEEDDDDDDEEELNNESGLSGEYSCSVCDLQLSSKFKLQDHMNLHTGARPYCCAECGKRFCQKKSYRVHLRTHAQAKVDVLQCRVCLKCFLSPKDLKDHLSRTHFENEFYECDLCKRVFTSLKACKNHVMLHKSKQDVVCEVCGRNFNSPKSLARHQRTTCHHNFKCTDCTKTFTKKNALLKHSFSHLGLLPYTCVRCHCHFRLAKLYRQHKCEPERLHCVACLREFPSQEAFKQHKKDTGCWGNQEPKGDEIRCLECGQRFDTSEELKKHAGAHQRVLKCAECGKGFRSALLLMSHMGGHAGKSPCLCQSCGVGFPHQQNYDSHLKTCGKTPQPASAPKKRPASKSSSSDSKMVVAKPESKKPKNPETKPTVVLNNPAEPVKHSGSPGPLTGVSGGSVPSDGLWKLTLDKQPPPGVNLVVFLPVCASQTTGLNLPSASSPTLPVLALQGQPQEALLHTSGVPLNGHLNLDNGINPECEAPLDLSKKCNSSKSAPSNISLLPKREPGEWDTTGEANGTETKELKNSYSKAIVKTNPEEKYSEVKQFKIDPMDLSSFEVNTTSSRLIIDIKKEPQSPGPDRDPKSSTSCQLTEKEIKMEVDI
ncbi:zinc finger protein 572 [Notothenia coriiceps]|uniref:Zinc finger protein 572-like n=1 Tax=Notothenia coriiceps TaxID=8208 RepID=A0A6I9PDI4_9TELE|nr:PREDICTED: zinc finger protein 572-like [Notothenia coriiceps]XP_010786243.1 PREDICTED: zinc finger protein 572-like [Notothenia coriiceps]